MDYKQPRSGDIDREPLGTRDRLAHTATTLTAPLTPPPATRAYASRTRAWLMPLATEALKPDPAGPSEDRTDSAPFGRFDFEESGASMIDYSMISWMICWCLFGFLRYLVPFMPKRSVAFYSEDHIEEVLPRKADRKRKSLRRRPSQEDVKRARVSLNRSFPGLEVKGHELEESCYKDNEGKIVIENNRVSRRFWNSDIGDISEKTLGKYESLRRVVEEPIATRFSDESSEGEGSDESVGRTLESFESLLVLESETSLSSTNGLQPLLGGEVAVIEHTEKPYRDELLELIARLCPDIEASSVESFQLVESGHFDDVDVVECFVYFSDIVKAAHPGDIPLLHKFYTNCLEKGNPCVIAKFLHIVNADPSRIDFTEVIFAVFDRFTTDAVSETVRENLLECLADLTATIQGNAENLYHMVARIGTFPPPESQYNWRYFECYLRQCCDIVMMPVCVEQLISVFADAGVHAAIHDKRCKVRERAAQLLARIVSRLVALEGDPEGNPVGRKAIEFNEHLLRTFANRDKEWRQRQIYAYIIEVVFAENLLSEKQFNELFSVPFFIRVLHDPIPNIRLQFCRALLCSDPNAFSSFGMCVVTKIHLKKLSEEDKAFTVRQLASEALQHLGGLSIEYVEDDDVRTAREGNFDEIEADEDGGDPDTNESDDSGVQTAEEISG
ncbi:hypothetical protein QR680_009174 [Steinernema hermaphroditum]|uniref:Uncharacterized protein n=1 Tax=Steinernema hermaphroditum TaxID=289476 RepID=A0AA39M977_9BILA|nr:hypothetical protein QR680_009174 [Steinernema hermaphroditum]